MRICLWQCQSYPALSLSPPCSGPALKVVLIEQERVRQCRQNSHRLTKCNWSSRISSCFGSCSVDAACEKNEDIAAPLLPWTWLALSPFSKAAVASGTSCLAGDRGDVICG